MSAFAKGFALSEPIEGWMTERQAKLLFSSAARLTPGDRAVEIGSHHGKSTIILASALPEGAKLTAIDPFDDPRWGGGPAAFDIFTRNLEQAGVRDRVDLERDFSGNVARRWPTNKPVRLLYVDGAHDVKTASEDITLWQPFLTPDATILIHDAFSSVGVTHAILRELATSKEYALKETAGSLVAFQRGPVAAIDRARLVGRLGYLARNVAVKLALRRDQRWAARALGHRGSHPPY